MSLKYGIIFAVWFTQVANYMERVVMGFAGPSMMQTLHIEPKVFGTILSSFAFGYFLAQIPGGMLADRWGARRILIIGPLFWALFTGITGLLVSVTALIAVRFCFGLAEGISNAASYKVVGDNYDAKTRAKAVAVWVTAFAVAPAFTGPIVGYLLSSFSWQWVFAMLAIPAVIAAVMNYALIGRASAAIVPAKSLPRPETFEPALLRNLLREPSIWLIGVAYSLWNVAFWGFLGWMPSYLAMERHIDIKSAGVLGGLPYMCALIGVVLTGWLGSGPFYRHRPVLLAATYLLAGASLYIAYSATDLTGSLIGLSSAAFFIYAGLATYGMVVLDLAPEKTRAAYSGVVSTMGQVGSITAPAIIGYLVSETGSFTSGFIFMIAALCFAAVGALALVPFSSVRQGGIVTAPALTPTD
jgi:sugar phosphate permease